MTRRPSNKTLVNIQMQWQMAKYTFFFPNKKASFTSLGPLHGIKCIKCNISKEKVGVCEAKSLRREEEYKAGEKRTTQLWWPE